jgi:hypothetical protein
MADKFKKALLLCLEKYSLYNSLLEILHEISETAKIYYIRRKLNRTELRLYVKMYRFTYAMRSRRETHFFKTINKILLEEIDIFRPDQILL